MTAQLRGPATGFRAAFGPGIVYAAAAVGVSHLVQSTRAGADYGFALTWVVLLALAVKYPFFEFGPRFSAATGMTLLEGYRRVGAPALAVLMALVVLPTQAAVTLVTAALLANLVPVGWSASVWSGVVLLAVALLLGLGRYPWLDHAVKLLMLLLILATALAAALAAVAPTAPAAAAHPPLWDAAGIAFIIALAGWMPAPIEISVAHSLWSEGRRRQTNHRPSLPEARLDFHIGYGLTTVLALMFLAMGAWLMYGRDMSFAPGAVGFTQQLIGLYTAVLGDWTWPLVALAAFAAMFSTTLAVSDVYPRIFSRTLALLWPARAEHHRSAYWAFMILIMGGGLVIIVRFAQDLAGLIDLVTTIAFLSAPLLGYLNYRAVTHPSVPAASQPPRWLRVHAWLGILGLALFGLCYLIWRFA